MVGGIKMFADGALGSRTASMLQPFVREPNNWGVMTTDPDTRWPAYAAGEEAYHGSISPGKVADLVLLGQDLVTLDPMAIPNTPIEMTVIDGRIVCRQL